MSIIPIGAMLKLRNLCFCFQKKTTFLTQFKFYNRNPTLISQTFKWMFPVSIDMC